VVLGCAVPEPTVEDIQKILEWADQQTECPVITTAGSVKKACKSNHKHMITVAYKHLRLFARNFAKSNTWTPAKGV
jgi:hypothetical protein